MCESLTVPSEHLMLCDCIDHCNWKCWLLLLDLYHFPSERHISGTQCHLRCPWVFCLAPKGSGYPVGMCNFLAFPHVLHILGRAFKCIWESCPGVSGHVCRFLAKQPILHLALLLCAEATGPMDSVPWPQLLALRMHWSAPDPPRGKAGMVSCAPGPHPTV